MILNLASGNKSCLGRICISDKNLLSEKNHRSARMRAAGTRLVTSHLDIACSTLPGLREKQKRCCDHTQKNLVQTGRSYKLL